MPALINTGAISLVVAGLLWVPAAMASYEIGVEKEAEITPLNSVGIVPMVCPAGLDCKVLEKNLQHELERRAKFTVVGTRKVLDLMLELGYTDLDDEKVFQLGGELQVDALLVPVIHHTGEQKDPIWRWLFLPLPGGMQVHPTSVKKADIEVFLVGTKPVKLLLRGSGVGESRISSRARIVNDMFSAILEKIFGSPTK